MKKYITTAAIASAMALTSQPSQGEIIISIFESGSDVIANISGSIDDLTGATISQTGAGAFLDSAIRPNSGLLEFGDGLHTFNNYDIGTLPAAFGTSSTYTAGTSTTFSGSPIFIRNINAGLWIEENYVLGTSFSGTNTYAGESFTSLGLTPGSYQYSWANPGIPGSGDAIVVNISGGGGGGGAPAAVPEPGQVAASLLLLAGIGGYAWTKHRKAAKKATATA